ncbi:hypothetical protein FT663_01356 [Candidozyma haemuli var. vulneris]|uniref:Thioredoxin n=1 Tax=Candidozyma haemuli TaxID=45357 RepID=A0A2V1B0W5_9ASCO|nr:thioredoxin [[Candida] haemuloni]KAF3991469.1 hypothetical protein FT662_01705 [[Candida] haemuloni var. vulneris]KAF3994556.1 hypothetical protein FT663_01356 [[Candida] haemuloni var. vulneris]PVH22791.1 thioredoxin [[Candida] haemuloni]
MSQIQFVKNKADFDQYLSKNKYLVAQFTASWCGPCQAIKPLVDDLYASEKYQKLEVVRVDLDSCQDVASQYKITSVPTFVFFESGKEVNRLQGASQKMVQNFDQLNEKALADPNAAGRSSGAATSASSSASKEFSSLIPKGYQVLNDVIHFGELVSLNALPLKKGEESKPSTLFKVGEKNTAVLSDADSQALFFVPLNNISKVYSVLLKISDLSSYKGDLELDEEELSDETQPPQTLKLWVNKPGIMSFDDAAADKNAPHVETLDLTKVSDGWYEAKLRFVRFQSVQNITVFIDGDDEDKHTVVDKVIFIGVSGDSREQGSVQQLEEE